MCPRGTQPGGLTHTRDCPSQIFATKRNATTPRAHGLTPFWAILQAAPSRTQRQVSTAYKQLMQTLSFCHAILWIALSLCVFLLVKNVICSHTCTMRFIIPSLPAKQAATMQECQIQCCSYTNCKAVIFSPKHSRCATKIILHHTDYLTSNKPFFICSYSKHILAPSEPCVLLDRTYNGSFQPSKHSLVSNIQVNTINMTLQV